MMDETKLLWVLDFLSERAKEFIQVSDDVLAGERSLQARDGMTPTEWQACSTVSAFINYVAETERVRYGHFAFDLERKNNEHKARDAKNVLGRMMLFWDYDESDDLTDEQLAARQELIDQFIANDVAIKNHIVKQPDMYEEGVPQETHREWSIKLRILGEKEASILRKWRKLIDSQGASSKTPVVQ